MSRKKVIAINSIAMIVGYICFGHFLSTNLIETNFTIIFVVLSLLNISIAQATVRESIIEKPKSISYGYATKQLTILVTVITVIITIAAIISIIL